METRTTEDEQAYEITDTLNTILNEAIVLAGHRNVSIWAVKNVMFCEEQDTEVNYVCFI